MEIMIVGEVSLVTRKVGTVGTAELTSSNYRGISVPTGTEPPATQGGRRPPWWRQAPEVRVGTRARCAVHEDSHGPGPCSVTAPPTPGPAAPTDLPTKTDPRRRFLSAPGALVGWGFRGWVLLHWCGRGRIATPADGPRTSVTRTPDPLHYQRVAGGNSQGVNEESRAPDGEPGPVGVPAPWVVDVLGCPAVGPGEDADEGVQFAPMHDDFARVIELQRAMSIQLHDAAQRGRPDRVWL